MGQAWLLYVTVAFFPSCWRRRIAQKICNLYFSICGVFLKTFLRPLEFIRIDVCSTDVVYLVEDASHFLFFWCFRER